jgi:two-component system response regulator DctR
MPGMNGLELQARLVEHGTMLPILFITSTADVPTAVAAMRQGAFDLIPKPIEIPFMIEKVQEAIKLDAQRVAAREQQNRARHLWDSLTPREQEVIELVVAGLSNKQIASKLSISEKTVEVHRARGTQKMQVSSMAELVRLHLSIAQPAA